MDDHALMRAWQEGDGTAFEQLYRHHKDSLLRFLWRQVGDSAAEELFQDIWMKVIKARLRYRPTASFKTWLYTIARNRLLDHYRSQQRQPMMEWDETQPLLAASDPQGESANHQQVQRLLALLKTLPTEQREVFLLKEEAGFTVPEIARLIDCSLEAAKSRLRYAIKKLQQGMEAYCDA
ncbi:sigma-70 family RNA polymerase sigma factor [Porticoccus sp. W117]|uniref:sigma-70 family RNA polymerase sigma factor n=1 Tax=Porticoccus sp. W117 TaxID=3054777 RepID=UPI002598CF56|nr:sigma-70 family RNA polymerase sigma factor [Porticoccus sp. W117]MDM3871992.1 sigma-70 family RNA polymerase sigma factor [Porticoccus sp. W117]